MDNAITTWIIFSLSVILLQWILVFFSKKKIKGIYRFTIEILFNIGMLGIICLQMFPIYWWYATKQSFPSYIPILISLPHIIVVLISITIFYKVINKGL
ncbi:hypothetical protein LJK88_44110 [Paenibacillus sp. P26]|nr:hypothetical protein LJK88_44110 [Paenibacillus sp. P26]